MTENFPFRVLLYYRYVSIDDYRTMAQEHLNVCKELGLRGRIIIAPEGINGTVSGTIEQTDRYIAHMHADPRFADMWFKSDPVPDHVFKKMFVRARNEIVTLDWKESIDPNKATGQYLNPVEFHRMLQQDDVIVIDGRNDYEFEMGHFHNAIRPDVRSFKEFPEWIEQKLSDKKDRPILTYCTGGIRCEKLSGLMMKQGFKNVFQLHGGIDAYRKDPLVRGDLFEGQCYVFDDRIGVPVNQVNPTIVTHCKHCGVVTDRFANCAHLDCHTRFYVCADCEKKFRRSCSSACAAAEHHEWNGVNATSL